MRQFLCAGLLLATVPSVHAEMAIWQWAFVTLDGDDLTSGNGGSLFTVSGSKFTGPLHADKLEADLVLTIDGTHARGTFTPRNFKGEPVTLEGNVTWRKSADVACVQVVRISHGEHYMGLERPLEHCPESATEEHP